MQRVVDAVVNSLTANNVVADQLESIRLFHGRGQTYEGLGYINVDWFQPVLLITLYQQPDHEQWQVFANALTVVNSVVTCAVVQHRYRRDGPVEFLWGELPENILAVENQLKFLLSLGEKQNIGFFLDMAPGRRWLQDISHDKRVLNLFSYTCPFSVAAIAGGASTVLNVDMSKAALNVGRENHRINQQNKRLHQDVQFLSYDIFRSWKKIVQKGPYDVVVIDPPSRQKGSFIATKDYCRVVRRLPDLMPEGGDVLVCLNAPEMGEDFLFETMEQEVPEARFIRRLNNRSDMPESDNQRSLKMLHYQLLAKD
jgi:23S rRNA (cytosine1962-C5)-methyltransferase